MPSIPALARRRGVAISASGSTHHPVVPISERRHASTNHDIWRALTVGPTRTANIFIRLRASQ